MWSKMRGWKAKDGVVLCLYLLFMSGVYAASVPHKDTSKFSMGSIMEAALPAIHPIVAAGSNRCEAFKSFFGLTYEQMQAKYASTFQDSLTIDHITKNGNIKYNITAYKQFRRFLGTSRDVVVLVHGFLESSDGVMVQGLAPSLLKQPGLVVLALDGRKVISLEYFRSSTYARFMGENLGAFLSEIIKEGQDPAKITLIGHSLGAHIAGIAGKRVHQLTGKMLSRIAGLDPAGPCFSNISLEGRLDPGDADYVDVIHTNAGMLGLLEPVGRKDFYPAGGMTQPGCFLSTCDHSRAWQLFAESITAPKRFPARKCGNWTMFKSGLCSKKEVAFMGMGSKAGSPGVYYLNTGSSSPYGLGAAGSG
ncbi:pancreatic lipase-related protein 3-like isoform X1 [Ostrinia furnacalis]|uniref:pancreatic lipase-related protein 3-like isoform X1 n=1 Tax=Ostrinia furnacalis TaxID=93504 RepID=UPI00103CD426|nr:pancreatic lipase-related protein 3-like isoform X1 [Ostrinia furnacalis]